MKMAHLSKKDPPPSRRGVWKSRWGIAILFCVLAAGFSGCDALRDLGLLPADEPAWEPDTKPPSEPATVAFTDIQADGGGAYPTTALTLHFSKVIAGLSAGDITLTPPGGAGITKGALEGSGPSYTLYVSGITADGVVNVSAAKAGYTISGNPTVAVCSGGESPLKAEEVVFSGLTADGAGPATKLALAFGGQGIDGLTAANIHLNPGGTGAAKGELACTSNTSYTLSVSGITQAGDVSVTVTKESIAFKPASRTAVVLDAAGPAPQLPGGGAGIAFDGAVADGGGAYPTTALTLHFSDVIDGLSAVDVTLTPVGSANSGITKGALEGSGPTYTLYVGNVAVDGWVDVSVAKAGYAVSGNPKRVAVYPGTPAFPDGVIPAANEVVFISLTADGEAYTSETKNLKLTFASPGIAGLDVNDIYLNPGVTGMVKGALYSTASPTVYNLGVTGLAAEGDVSVSLAKAGYAFKPTSRAAAVHRAGTPVTMTVEQTGGSALAGASSTTTGLALSFDTDIGTLAKGEITLTAQDPENSGIAIGSVTENVLTVSGIKKTGYITVTVKKSGYSIPAQGGVQVYYAETVTFAGVMADGQLGTTPTTVLTLSFNKDIAGLTAGDITLTEGTGLAAKAGDVWGGGATWNLPVTVSKRGTVGVAVSSPSGYIVTGSPKTGVQVFSFLMTQDSAKANPMAEGGTLTVIDVGETIYEVHTFTESGTLQFFGNIGTVEVLVVGGGNAGGLGSTGNGKGGGCVYNPVFDPGNIVSVPVTVGAGGSTQSQIATGYSEFGTGNACIRAQGGFHDVSTGYLSDISGSPITYSRSGIKPPIPNTGSGGREGYYSGTFGSNGSSGIVIVRWPYVAP